MYRSESRVMTNCGHHLTERLYSRSVAEQPDTVPLPHCSRIFSHMTSYSQRQAVELQSVLRGEGRERVCRVSAIKVTNPFAPARPAYIQPVIHHQDDEFPVGH